MLKGISWRWTFFGYCLTGLPLGRTAPTSIPSPVWVSFFRCLIQQWTFIAVNCTFCCRAKQQNDALQLLWPNTHKWCNWEKLSPNRRGGKNKGQSFELGWWPPFEGLGSKLQPDIKAHLNLMPEEPQWIKHHVYTNYSLTPQSRFREHTQGKESRHWNKRSRKRKVGNKTGQQHGPDHLKNLLRAEGIGTGSRNSKLWTMPVLFARLCMNTLTDACTTKHSLFLEERLSFSCCNVSKEVPGHQVSVEEAQGDSMKFGGQCFRKLRLAHRAHHEVQTLTSVWEWPAFLMVWIPDVPTDLGLQSLGSATSAGHLYKWEGQHPGCANTPELRA